MERRSKNIVALLLVAALLANGLLATVARDHHDSSRPHQHGVANHYHSGSSHSGAGHLGHSHAAPSDICDPHDHGHSHPGQPRPCNDEEQRPACQFVVKNLLHLLAPLAADVDATVQPLAARSPLEIASQRTSSYHSRAPPAIA